MLLKRICNIPGSYSFFLFGARGTGKSTLLKVELAGKQCLWIDFLDLKLLDRYQRDPDLLYQEVKERRDEFEWLVLDEVQKVPAILNTVHRILESNEFTPPYVAITGSSARKLKHGGANLLAGRAFVRNLYPLTFVELSQQFSLDTVLNYGSLPKIWSFMQDMDRIDFLESYALTYLNEEVWGEHLICNVAPFRKFLEVSAAANGQIINFAKISRDVHADEKTVRSYFQILEDTLSGFQLEAYHRSIRKRQPKIFLF